MSTRCRHTLDDVVAYEVRQTIVDGEVLGLAGPIVARIEGATNYGAALSAAQDLRVPGVSWALVDNVYGCGCVER